MLYEDSFLESLLYEEEDVTFDTKSQQYKFVKSTDDEKSELLKDILSFSNAWRRCDSYIFVGAKEIKGGMNIITGVNHYLDDAHIQQFINEKTQKPISFSITNQVLRGEKVAIIHIPLQERPFYLTKDFGKLKRNVVYIRRGSSCGEATPDEILKMGNSQQLQQKHPYLSISINTNIKSSDNVLRVNSYKVLAKEDTINNLRKLVISDKDIALVLNNKDKLDSIKDTYPDGSIFFPYKTSKVLDFKNKIDAAMQMISNDFSKFCQLYNLYLRSFEFANSTIAKIRLKQGIQPFCGSITLFNKGTSPASQIILYIESNNKIQFLNHKDLIKLSFDYKCIPDDIIEIIKKAKDLENGVDNPIITWHEKQFGHKNNVILPKTYTPPLNQNIHQRRRFGIKNNSIFIEIDEGLMHNHNLKIECEDVYLCPLISQGELAEIKYEIHAANLPIPQTGILQVVGDMVTDEKFSS